MSPHHPTVRIYSEHRQILIRDGLELCFYMRRSHHEVAPLIVRSLELYLRAIEPQTLAWYVDQEGDWQELDSQGWSVIQHKLLQTQWPIVQLKDTPGGEQAFRFEYRGKWFEDPRRLNEPNMVSAVSFWLPTEFLEAQGPEHVRQLALALAALFPFNSGHAGLSFNAVTGLFSGPEEWRQLAFRYPGMDMSGLDSVDWHLGTRVRAPHWLTFLGQPVLGELGGIEGLRARLTAPSTTVEQLASDRAVVTLGTWPEAGDTQAGNNLPEYRELARVLEPWLYQHPPLKNDWASELRQRWERRFLD